MADDRPTEPLAPGAADASDLGPLAWVLDGTSKAVLAATRLLKRVAHESANAPEAPLPSADASALHFARQQLHQVAGVLEMVGQGAAARFVRGMERAARGFIERVGDCTPLAASTLEKAGFALIEYLEARLGESPVAPLALFPQYREVLQLTGAERIHPADLWEFRWRWEFPILTPGRAPLTASAAVRARIDEGVREILRQGDRAAASDLAQVCAGLAAGARQAEVASFWALCAGFFEALAADLVPADLLAKRAVSQVLLQYTALAHGQRSIPQRLVLDLLFFCAQAHPASGGASPDLMAVRTAWRLQDHEPVAWSEPTFGLHDPAVLAQARRRVAGIKENWSALAGGDLSRLKTCVDQLGLVSESLRLLHEASAPLAHALDQVAQGLQQSGRPPRPELAMETATALLFLEASFARFRPRDEALAARMSELAQRLDAARNGAPAGSLQPWIEELYRNVSDRQTMGTVVGELRGMLGEVEHKLDQFFRHPQDRSVLDPVPGLLMQMRGVLSVLGLDQAVLAVGRIRERIEDLRETQAPDGELHRASAFDALASSLGVLGFLIDTLSYQPVLARTLFHFDEASEEFRFVSGRVAPPPRPTVAETAPAAPGVFSVGAVDAPPQTSHGPLAPARSGEDSDAELRQIFLDEAREVLAAGARAVEALAHAPSDAENLAVLRRAFHTLKGSSRMVGLAEFGAAAWSLQQLLDVWLTEQKPAGETLRAVASDALAGLGRWVQDIAAGRDEVWLAHAFETMADALRLRGQRLPLLLPAAAGAEAPVEGDVDEMPVRVAAPDVPPAADEPEARAADRPVEPAPAAPGLDAGAALLEFDFPDLELPAIEPAQAQGQGQPSSAPDEVAGAAASMLDFPDLDLGAPGAPQLLHSGMVDVVSPAHVPAAAPHSEHDIPVPAAQPIEPVEFEFHLTPGPADDAGVLSVEARAEVPANAAAVPAAESAAAETAPVPETGEPAPASAAGSVPAADDRAAPITVVGTLNISTPLYEVYLGEADEWSQRLAALTEEWSHRPAAAIPADVKTLAHALAGASATVGFGALSTLARAFESAIDRLLGQPAGTAEQAAVLGHAVDDIRRLLHQFAAGILREPEVGMVAALEALEPARVAAPAAPDDGGMPAGGLDAGITVANRTDPDLFPIFEEEAEELLPQLSAALRRWVAQPQDEEARRQTLRVLHTLKGSARLAGAMRLGEMAHRTESAVEQLGTEDLSAAQIEPLLGHFDRIEADFQGLRASVATPPVAPTPVSTPPSAPPPAPPVRAAPAFLADVPEPAPPRAPLADELAPQPAPEPDHPPAVAAPTPLVAVAARADQRQTMRVPAPLLDRLMVQTGEVMSSRARLSNDVAQLSAAMRELTRNVEQLREHLRDVELQAETQMQSRLAQSREAGQSFDPLEFDRFTRMQELSRMMAESVNDLATVQRNMQRAIASSEDALAAQTRQTRELQRDLLRTRMVEFRSVAERLHRVVRQAAGEEGKQAGLEIVGGSVEIDRGILERMTPAFEHLLRNAVVHGIEKSDARRARGKPAAGTITMELQHAGNDVAVELRDDGAGLNLARIRARGIECGLIGADQQIGDAALAQLIFEPGFSTATALSDLAGRGVGLDVVQMEVRGLGGRIETRTSEAGGASFRLILPLTTAVTSVVLIRAGDLVVGAPASLIEQVRRVSPGELGKARATGGFTIDGDELPFYWAGALLQHSARSREMSGQALPVVVFRSAAQRIALHVDEVLGNQDVVVKALGTQLSRLPGLTAITTLPSGAVTLIYNPVALATVYSEAIRALEAGSAESADAGEHASEAADIPLILVVDDSITVRRVMQRLLLREGYRVALAADGLQGLECLRRERPTVVLSDIEMPRMDGFDFLRSIRADASLRDLPVVMVTSRSADKHREHARQLGANHYLGKPYSEDELLGLIRGYAVAAAAR